jgi:hypothetical protein
MRLKKVFTGFLLVIVGMIIGIAATLAVCYFTGAGLPEKFGIYGKSITPDIGAQATSAELTAYAFEIVGYIKEGDYEKLSEVVHPEYGVVFSPYATINLSSNKVFTATQVKGFAKDTTKYVWGKYDGSGNPIELTPSDYFKDFVFDRDYTLAAHIGVDTIVNTGNSLENIKEVFPTARFVDFHIPGTDPEYGGLDWSSLRLAFEEYNGRLRLTLILHSEWTI